MQRGLRSLHGDVVFDSGGGCNIKCHEVHLFYLSNIVIQRGGRSLNDDVMIYF